MGKDLFEGMPAALRAMDERVPSDEVFTLLADPYARYVIYYLHAQSATTLDELAAVIAGLEATESKRVATPSDHERIHLRLYHVVLPKLETRGYLELDPDGQTVERKRIPTEVSEMLGLPVDG